MSTDGSKVLNSVYWKDKCKEVTLTVTLTLTLTLTVKLTGPD